jgi:hypothetical protein
VLFEIFNSHNSIKIKNLLKISPKAFRSNIKCLKRLLVLTMATYFNDVIYLAKHFGLHLNGLGEPAPTFVPAQYERREEFRVDPKPYIYRYVASKVRYYFLG